MASRCKFGKVSRVPRKGRCRTRRKTSTKKTARRTTSRRRKLSGAAKWAKQCKGNKGSAFKACMRHALNGLANA